MMVQSMEEGCIHAHVCHQAEVEKFATFVPLIDSDMHFLAMKSEMDKIIRDFENDNKGSLRGHFFLSAKSDIKTYMPIYSGMTLYFAHSEDDRVCPVAVFVVFLDDIPSCLMEERFQRGYEYRFKGFLEYFGPESGRFVKFKGGQNFKIISKSFYYGQESCQV